MYMCVFVIINLNDKSDIQEERLETPCEYTYKTVTEVFFQLFQS